MEERAMTLSQRFWIFFAIVVLFAGIAVMYRPDSSSSPLSSPPTAIVSSAFAGAASTSYFAFLTEPYLLGLGVCSPPITVQAESASNLPLTAQSNATVFVSSNISSTLFYSDSACKTKVTSVIIPTGQSKISFYIKGAAAGWSSARASSTGIGAWKQNEYFEVPPAVAPPAQPSSLP